MLTIKNIDEAIGDKCYGRSIYHIGRHTNALGEQSYVFEFDAIEDLKDYNKPQEVHLIRNIDSSGDYRLFVMGLQLGTESKVKADVIKDKQQLLVEISICLSKAKTWWKNSNIKGQTN